MKHVYNYELLSTNPLWILDDDNEPQVIKNKYDNLEVIRVYDNTNSEFNHYDYPIEPLVTYIPEIGEIFFKTQNDALRHSSLMSSESGILTLLDNGFEQSRHNKAIDEFKKLKPVENGLYVIPEFDEALVIPSSEWINTICYLSENGVESVKNADENINFYLHKYLNMIDIETRHNLENERLVFEIYTEMDKVYINHFFVKYHNCPSGPFYITRIMNYIVCPNKCVAETTLSRIESGNWNILKPMVRTQTVVDMSDAEIAKREQRKAIVGSVARFVGNYAWDHLDGILNWVKVKYRNHKSKK